MRGRDATTVALIVSIKLDFFAFCITDGRFFCSTQFVRGLSCFIFSRFGLFPHLIPVLYTSTYPALSFLSPTAPDGEPRKVFLKRLLSLVQVLTEVPFADTGEPIMPKVNTRSE